MKSFRTLKTALRALRRNVTRAVLTTLGIVIGIAAVIAMMEIGNGSSIAIQRTIASMGANTLVVMPGTAASGGVTYGAGSVMTLTPQDGDAILKECPAVGSVAPVVRARTQVVYGNRNWVPMYIYGTTPSFLQVREWTDMDEGEAFTEHDVRNSSKVCLVGQTIVRELFGGQSPIGKEIRVRNVAFKVVGVLRTKGANMMGMDQDDILLAPWTTIKYRVVGYLSCRQSIRAVRLRDQHAGQYAQPDLSEHSAESLSGSVGYRAGGHAATDPVCQRGPDPDRRAVWQRRFLPPSSRSPCCCGRRHHLRAIDPNDFNVRDMTEITKAMSSTTALITKLLAMCGDDFAGRRRRRHYEHHACLGHRTNARDRPAHGSGRRAGRHPAAVFDRGGRAVSAWRHDGHHLGRCSSYIVASVLHWPTAAFYGCDRGRCSSVGQRRRYFWLLSGVEGVAARSHRGASI